MIQPYHDESQANEPAPAPKCVAHRILLSPDETFWLPEESEFLEMRVHNGSAHLLFLAPLDETRQRRRFVTFPVSGPMLAAFAPHTTKEQYIGSFSRRANLFTVWETLP